MINLVHKLRGGIKMKDILKTDDFFIEVEEKRKDLFRIYIYSTVDDNEFIEVFLSRFAMAQLINSLTRVHLGLKPY